ncbi:MAG: transposase [Bradyrhizobium sp.]|nr:transposase [Bradyrhizobium sp.]
MRSAEFRDWLSERLYKGEHLTSKGLSTRTRKLPRVERALGELGFAERDLDAVHAAGRWPELMTAVGKVAADWRGHETAARRMAPQAADPTRQLSNLLNPLRQYNHFAEGRPPSYDSENDEPDAAEIDEVALALLKERFLATYTDFETGGGFPGESGYHPQEDTYKRALIAKVRDWRVSMATDARGLGEQLLAAVLDDRDVNLIGDYRRKTHLSAVRARSDGALASAVGTLTLSNDDPVGAAVRFVDNAWPIVREGSEQSLPFADIRVLATLFPALAHPDQAIAVSYTRFHNLVVALRGKSPFGNNVLTAEEYRAILDLAGELFAYLDDWGWRPRDLWDVQGFIWVACVEKLEADNERPADLVRRYAFDTYFAPARAQGARTVTIRAGDLHNALGMTNAHANVCQALRGQKMQDLADVGVPTFTGPDNSSTTTFTYVLAPREGKASQKMSGAPATNQILYGPPGTGKTFATARRAVELCDGAAAAEEKAMRGRYQDLVAAGQIRFVTFHQSYAYEDFVEGLRPVTPQAGGEEASGGFHLEAVPGVFRELATVAEHAWRSAGTGAAFEVGARQVFKMSLGRAGAEDHIFDAAIEGGYIVLGWGGDVDWTPYDSYEAIHARWNEDHPDTNGNDSNIAQVSRFRVDMKPGDLVVISYGNTRFRAIGEIVGPYEYGPTDVPDYNHRRRVKWLFEPDEPLPVSFYAKPFSMRSCYLLREEFINREALQLLLPGTGAGAASDPKQFVLICDEINRANISKVFGELITLIEPDKRLGCDYEIRLTLPYSKQSFGVPPNLHILGTMNTADRSIALLDTALRRRFTFEEIAPDPDLLANASNACGVDLIAMLKALNGRIEYLFDREHQVGHAYFMSCDSRAALDRVMRFKIIPLLAEYFYEDWSKVAAVLGDGGERGAARSGFLDRVALPVPPGLGDAGDGEGRYRWEIRKSFDYAGLQ